MANANCCSSRCRSRSSHAINVVGIANCKIVVVVVAKIGVTVVVVSIVAVIVVAKFIMSSKKKRKNEQPLLSSSRLKPGIQINTIVHNMH